VLRLLVDECVHGDVVHAALRRQPNLDLVRVQDVGLAGADDATILQSAAAEDRVVLTSDVSTLIGVAYERVRVGAAMPGVFVIAQGRSLSPVIDDILLLAEVSVRGEWEGQVQYLPL